MRTLQESLLDKQKTLQSSGLDVVIINWLKENTNYNAKPRCFVINPKTYDINVIGSVAINNKSLVELPEYIHFGEVCGEFSFEGCSKLISLHGSPKKVMDFVCSNCKSLKSLEGAPEDVLDNFKAYNCTGLTNLNGISKIICGVIDLRYCGSLISIEGIPRNVQNILLMECKKLKTLKGLPDEFDGSLNVSGCTSLTSLQGCPKNLNFLNCSNTAIKNLKGSPQHIYGAFFCNDCENLTSLEGAPIDAGEVYIAFNKKSFTKKDVRSYIDSYHIETEP